MFSRFFGGEGALLVMVLILKLNYGSKDLCKNRIWGSLRFDVCTYSPLPINAPFTVNVLILKNYSFQQTVSSSVQANHHNLTKSAPNMFFLVKTYLSRPT